MKNHNISVAENKTYSFIQTKAKGLKMQDFCKPVIQKIRSLVTVI
jgi:hypothetical protein